MEVISINFKDDGFIYNNKFYSFQSVSSITPIERKEYDNYMDVKTGFCNKNEAYAYIQYSFEILFNNSTKIVIGDVWTMNLYKKNLPKSNNIFYKLCYNLLFGEKYVQNTDVDKFFELDTNEMKSFKSELEIIHNKLIDNFNSYKKNNS